MAKREDEINVRHFSKNSLADKILLEIVSASHRLRQLREYEDNEGVLDETQMKEKEEAKTKVTILSSIIVS